MLLHQLIEIFLVLLQPLQQVHLLVLQQRHLLVHLDSDTEVNGLNVQTEPPQLQLQNPRLEVLPASEPRPPPPSVSCLDHLHALCYCAHAPPPPRSPHSSACRCFPVQSECSPAPGRESSGRSRPRAASPRSPPASWRYTECVTARQAERDVTPQSDSDSTWKWRRSIWSLVPSGRSCPELLTVERSSWASASSA